MRKFIYLISAFFLMTSCDDGDIFEVNLDFDDTFAACGELVFYKTKTDPAESLSIYINNLTIDDVLETPFVNTDSVYVVLADSVRPVILDGNTNKFNYRSYSSLPSNPFCSDIPSSELNITNDSAGTGTATITVTLTEDDNDGIPSEFEDLNSSGDLTDDDTDGDGVPNFLDDDDDGDNVKTMDESHNYSAESGLSDALNTDLDNEIADGVQPIPNYLDNDDDGDETPTRDEQNLTPDDQNPSNDVSNSEVGPDYLNPGVNDSTPETQYRLHTINQIFEVSIDVFNLSIPQLSQDLLYFGVLDDVSVTNQTRNPKAIFN